MSAAAALVPVPATPVDRYDGLVMVVSPAEARRRVQELQAFVQEVMVPGVDYGTIPGTDKPSLYQPGAQKLGELYGFAHDFVDVTSTEDWEKPFFFYRRKCVLTARRDGRYVGSGIGSCNSREERYAVRWLFQNELPKGLDAKALRTKTIKGRNGQTYTKYAVPNPDIYSLVNTIEKMACKRAYIHAVIAVTRSAGLFTQDVEDLPAEVFGQVEETRPWQKGEEPTPPPPAAAAKPAAKAPPAPSTPKPSPELDALEKSFEDRLGIIARDGTMADLKRLAKEIAESPIDRARRAVLLDIYDLAASNIEARTKGGA